MTASSSVVLSNLAYLMGAVVVAVIGGLIVWLHHRQPKSVDADVESFQRGLRAIAPDSGRTAPVRPRSSVVPEGPPPSLAVTGPAAAPPDTDGGDGSVPPGTAGGPPVDEDRSVALVPAEERLPEPVGVDPLSHDDQRAPGPADGAGERAGAEAG
jgi:hypothetical protein